MVFGLQSRQKRIFTLLPSWLQKAMKNGMDGRAIHSRLQAARQQLNHAATDLSTRCLTDINTMADWQRQRPIMRQELLTMLGLNPLPERLPLNAQITGTLEQTDYRIEKIVFESLPGLYVTGNFYLPEHRTGTVPCVLYLNGHWPSLDGAKTGYQDRYLWYPANGFALLVIDPLGFGEIQGVHPGMNRLNQWHWLSLGYTPAGVEVWNAMRALDWLETRPEIDTTRVGVTGVSGGGVMTQFLAALDERVAVAAPSCSTYTIGTQASLRLVPEQCDCTFYPNVFGMDFPEVLALIAPRPLLILGGRKDPIFPPAGFREAFRRTRKIYDLFDDPDRTDPRIRLVESNQGHTDPPNFLCETHRWMCKWLHGHNGIEPMTEQPSPNPEPTEALRCTANLLPSALNYYIQDVWIKNPGLNIPTTPEKWVRRKEDLQNILRTRVFGWFPQSEIPFKTRRIVASGGYAGDFADFGEYEFDTEAGVPVLVRLLIPKSRNRPAPLIIWVKEPADQVIFPDLDEFFPILRTHALVILTPRFAESPLSGQDYACIERTAALVGRSVASLRVWDVLRAVGWVTRDRGIEPSEITVYGRGSAGITGLYAALFNSAIGHVILRDPPISHFNGPALPTILRDTDIEETAGMLAPRRLTILGHGQEAFKMTYNIYQLAESPTAIGHCSNLTEAILQQ